MERIQLKVNIIILVIFIPIFFGCQNRFNEVEAERTKLIDNIESYQSIGEFEKYLTERSIKWKSEESTTPKSGLKPSLNISNITIDNYSHNGFSGKLYICFFNNRLMETRFYPEEIEKYVESFSKKENVIFDNNSAFISPFTEIWITKDSEERKYIGWCDKRLDKEFNIWIKKYS